MGYYGSQKTGDTIHSPKNCLPGAGWDPVRSGFATISAAGGRQIVVNEYVIQQDEDKQLVFYWYQGRGRVIASEYAGKFWMVGDAISRNRTDGALVRLNTPINDNEASARARLVSINHGRLLQAQGKQNDAVIAFQSVVKGASDSAQAHYYLGVAYWQTGSLGQASSEFQEAVKASPGFPLALRSLAQLNLAQNHPLEARVYAQELVQKSPADVYDRILLGEILLREGDSRSAEEQFLAAGQLAPNQAAVHLDLGQVYSAEKKWPQAEKEFETSDSARSLEPRRVVCLC